MYFQLIDYQNRLDISVKTVETRYNSLEIIRKRFEEGIIPELDLNQAEAQWALAVATVPSYERSLARTSYALSVLLGEDPRLFNIDANLKEQLQTPNIPAGIPSKLLERRPDISQAEAQLRAQNANIGAAVAARFPSISLTGIVGAASNDLATLTTGGLAWSAGASLLGPIFEFGKNKRRVEVEKKKAEELIINYENVILYAFKDVEDALIGIETQKKELKAINTYFLAVDNAAKLSRMRYDKGVSSYLEVLENERSAFNAELQLSEKAQQLLSSYVSLYKSLGGGWLSAEEEAQAEQVKQAK
jgi:multidrug efflux system outer membrane protein